MPYYNPGLHILSELVSEDPLVFSALKEARTFFDQQIEKYGLTKVGEVYYQFENGGFTASVCLTESHLSIHTWPEYKKATFDIFLSNYMKDNDAVTRSIHEATAIFFKSEVLNYTEIKR